MLFRDRICHRRKQAQTRIMRHRSRSRASRHPFVSECRGPPVSFTSEHCTSAHPIRGFRGNTKVSRIPRRQGRSKAGRTKGMRIPRHTRYPLVLPTRFASVFKCTRIFRTQRSNKKNRHGKFRALHGADSDDGDDMAKKLTMEIQKFSSMTAHQNQIHQPTNPKHQNSPT